MKNKVLVSNISFSIEEQEIISKELSAYNTSFEQMEVSELFATDVVIVIVELVQNIGYNATYDILKYVFLQIYSKICNSVQKKTTIEFRSNGHVETVSLSFDLNNSQKDKIVDAVVLRLTSDLSKNGKKKSN